jgi:hypothetical protein
MALGDVAEDAAKAFDALRRLTAPNGPSIESPRVAIKHFVWTAHAGLRLNQRRLSRSEVEQAIRETHAERQPNDGRADWLIACTTTLGVHFEAVYDHPVGGDDATARVVSAWRID